MTTTKALKRQLKVYEENYGYGVADAYQIIDNTKHVFCIQFDSNPWHYVYVPIDEVTLITEEGETLSDYFYN